MKWLVVLLLAGAAVVGWRWLEARLQRRLQPRRISPSTAVERRPAPAVEQQPVPPPAAPSPLRPEAAPAPVTPPPVEGFAHGFSAVADGGVMHDRRALDDQDDQASDDGVGSYTIDDWGLQTVQQPAAPRQPAEPRDEPPDEPAPTVDFPGAPTELLGELGQVVEAGGAPDPEQVKTLAADPLARAAVYRLLKDARKVSLIPRRHRTQKAMAEADLVVWLTDSRLGRPPQAIEQVAVHTLEGPDGPMDWYLFRFRSERRSLVQHGWMAGVSGPWVRSEGPGGRPRGDTGSDFEPWADMTDEQHAGSVKELMDVWSGRS